MPTQSDEDDASMLFQKITSSSTETTNEHINILPFEHSDPFVDVSELLHKILIPASLIASQRSCFPLA